MRQVAVAGSGGTEGMANRAVALAQQMDVLESAVKAGNAALANQALGSVSRKKKKKKKVSDCFFESI